jgi:hypothetical protein
VRAADARASFAPRVVAAQAPARAT